VRLGGVERGGKCLPIVKVLFVWSMDSMEQIGCLCKSYKDHGIQGTRLIRNYLEVKHSYAVVEATSIAALIEL
jgi:hypothetical protein